MKRSGRKSAAQTPAPKKERIYGSLKNRKGSAASKKSAAGIVLSDSIIKTLEDKKDKYNSTHKSKVTLSTLKAVMRRGMGAYSSSHRPTITGGAPNSRQAWGFARVNKFLLKKGGTKVKAAYVQDDDLLAKGGEIGKEISCVNCGWSWNTNDSSEFDKYVCHKCGFDNRTFYDSDPIGFKNDGLLDSLELSMENLKKNGIVLQDNNGSVTLIAYNIGNQERKPSLYNKSLIYKSVQPLQSKNEIIQNLDLGNFESFDESKIEDYKKSHLIILNQNEVIYDSNNQDSRYKEASDIFKPTESIEDLAKKYSVSVDEVTKQVNVGIEKELEHTNDKEVAEIIALHHIDENLNYYDVLKENELEKGEIIEKEIEEPKIQVALPDTYADVNRLKEILAMQGFEIRRIVVAETPQNEDVLKKGGVVVGKSHQEADENGTGEKFVVASTGQIVELEGGEAVIVNKAMDSKDLLNFDNKRMTPREVASFLNHAYGGVKFEKGGEVECGCSHKKYYHGGELPSAVVNSLQGGEAVITKKTMDSQDLYMFEGRKLTPRQILSRINHKYGGVSFARGGITSKNKFSNENSLSKMIYFTNKVHYV